MVQQAGAVAPLRGPGYGGNDVPLMGGGPHADGPPMDEFSQLSIGSRKVRHVPLAKCRVLYLGSAVPMETAVGLEAVQQPLRERYPAKQGGDINGIDAWLTVYSSGMQLQYVADKNSVTWFPISTLHVCAAVKAVVMVNGSTGDSTPKFIALDSDGATGSQHPPMFAAIMRRTLGVKVLECHVFITKSNQAAMALVQSCTHAYEHKEGWTDEAPPAEVFQSDLMPPPQSGTMHLLPADPVQQEPAPPEFFEKPPPQGYFYTNNRELVRSYNVYGAHRMTQHRPPPPRGPPMIPQPMPPPGPRPFVMPPMMPGRGPPRPPFMPPPPGYFADWEMHAGQPIMVYGPWANTPGPDVHHKRRHKHRKKSRERRRHRSSSNERDRHHGNRHRDHRDHHERRDHRGDRKDRKDGRDRHRRSLPSSSDEADRHRRGGRPHTPPVDYNRHHSPVRHHDRRDRDHDRHDYRDPNPEVFYRNGDKADREETYSHHIETRREGRNDDRDRRFPDRDRGFVNSIEAERRVVGDMNDYPDPYKMNGFRYQDDDSQINLDMFNRRQDGGSRRPTDNLEHALGYYP